MKNLFIIFVVLLSIKSYAQQENIFLLKAVVNDKDFREHPHIHFTDCDTIFISDTIGYFKKGVFKDDFKKIVFISDRYLDRWSCATSGNCICHNLFIDKIETKGAKKRILFSYPVLNVYGDYTYRIKNNNVKKIKSKSTLLFID